MMKNLLILFILTFTIFACKENSPDLNRNETIEYYPNKPKVVFKKTVHLSDFDSVYYFYDNGQLFKKGKQYAKGPKIGLWRLYDRNSNPREIREWFPFYGKSRLNRVWHLNKDGDTLAWRYQDSIYNQTEFIHDTIQFRNTIYDLVYFNKDTIKLNEPFKAFVEVRSPSLRDYNNTQLRVIIDNEGNQFNYDFSNEDDLELYEFDDLTIDTINQKWFNGADFTKLVTFGNWFKTSGKKMIRGYYQEYSFGPFEEKDLDSVISYKVLFEKEIFVIDSSY